MRKLPKLPKISVCIVIQMFFYQKDCFPGAGKTTLMNTLNGRMPFTGSVQVGKMPLNKDLKRKMCYVLQQEVFFGNLTLQETLQVTVIQDSVYTFIQNVQL